MKVKDLKLHPPKILLMGTFGSGKTALSTSAGLGTSVIDLDNGLRTCMTLEDKFSKQRQDIDVKVCWEENPDKALAFSKAKSFVMAAAEACRQNKYDGKILVLDSYTTLAEGALRSVMRVNGMLGKVPQIQHWGQCFFELESLLAQLRSLPLVVIMIAHCRRVEIEGQASFEIATPGQKLPEKIPSYFDEVWCMRIKGSGSQKKYLIQTQGTSVIPCRTRGNLSDMTDADLGLKEILKRLGYDLDKSSKQEEPKIESK